MLFRIIGATINSDPNILLAFRHLDLLEKTGSGIGVIVVGERILVF
jgi:hypothetical protein